MEQAEGWSQELHFAWVAENLAFGPSCAVFSDVLTGSEVEQPGLELALWYGMLALQGMV